MTKILLVDDDAAFRYAAVRILRAAGFGVHEASDYRGALEILQSDVALDVMITDIVMPQGINGYALGRMATMRRPGLRLIYLTGYDLPTSEAGGPVLRKPVTGEDLVAAVTRAVAGETDGRSPA